MITCWKTNKTLCGTPGKYEKKKHDTCKWTTNRVMEMRVRIKVNSDYRGCSVHKFKILVFNSFHSIVFLIELFFYSLLMMAVISEIYLTWSNI